MKTPTIHIPLHPTDTLAELAGGACFYLEGEGTLWLATSVWHTPYQSSGSPRAERSRECVRLSDGLVQSFSSEKNVRPVEHAAVEVVHDGD